MRLETYKMATSILLKFQTLKCDVSRTIWRIEVSDGSLFCIFHTLSFERKLFFDRTCPLSIHSNVQLFLQSKQIGQENLINLSVIFIKKLHISCSGRFFFDKSCVYQKCVINLQKLLVIRSFITIIFMFHQ